MSLDDSIDFSLGDESDLKELLEDINSSLSLEPSCSFEYINEFNEDIFNYEREKPTKFNKIDKRIPSDVKYQICN